MAFFIRLVFPPHEQKLLLRGFKLQLFILYSKFCSMFSVAPLKIKLCKIAVFFFESSKNFFCRLLLSELATHGTDIAVQRWQCGSEQDKGGRTGRRERQSRDALSCQRRWARRRTSAWRRPACSLRTLCRRPPVRGLCRPSASSAGSWSWTLWTTAASTARWRLQSAPGRSRPCGPNWTREHSTRLTARTRPARAPG